jgi:WD40 repeat protein
MSVFSEGNLTGRDRFLTTRESHERALLSHQLQSSLNCNSTNTIKDAILNNVTNIKFENSADNNLATKVTFEGLYFSRLTQQSLIGQDRIQRPVPGAPDRILDAPGMVDDFYLNVLDWSVRNIVAVALGPSVYLWNGADGSVKELLTLSTGGGHVTSLSWIHDGKAVAVGSNDGYVQIWDVEKNRKLRTMITTPGIRVGALSWNKHLLSTGSRDGTVQTHDVRIAKHLMTENTSATGFEICGLKWSCDGQQLAAGSNDNLIRLWDVGGTNGKILEGHVSAVKALAWCPWKSKTLASGGGTQDRSIRLWNSTTGEVVEHVNTGSQVTSLLWSRNSRELLSAHGLERNHLAIWQVNHQARELANVAAIEHAHDSRILHMTLSPDGRTVATAAADESIKFWTLFRSSCGNGKGEVAKKPFDSNSNASPFSLRTKSFR